MEPYVTLPEKTQLQLASILTLSSNLYENRDKLISFGYTSFETVYPEKILNLKCYLYGNWRIFNFFTYYGEEKGVASFMNFMEIVINRRKASSHSFTYDAKIKSFFQRALSVEARGNDFEAGIENLFTLITSVYVQGDVTLPSILINQENEYSHRAFWWRPEKAGFANLIKPIDVPDYAKKFFDAMPKRIET